MHDKTDSGFHFDAWNPGLASRIPAALEPMVTLYRAGNSTVDYQRATELADFCGLRADQMIVFTVDRLIIHELLVRVTSDLSVPDGPKYEDLGISLRAMVANIYQGLEPEINHIQTAYDNRIAGAREYIDQQLGAQLFDAKREKPPVKNTMLRRWFGKKPVPAKKRSATPDDPKEFKALAFWTTELEKESDPTIRHCLGALIKIVNAFIAQRGGLVNEPELIATIATNYASNKIGDELVCEFIGERFERLVTKEGYRLLPLQQNPVVMNVKGASASGKSTIRPQQRQLADKLGIPWQDFALISPDYWRKYLLDYDSMGDDYKYAAMLTGQELAIIDKKLDRYMADKASREAVPHLLIDRFRFDSFSVDAGQSNDSKLLSRFGDRIFMFFMITSPAETVVRAWERGKTTGRYKAVDDLLYHNVEAFTGMPELFLSWVKSADKQVHFEFLNNDVPKGQLPKTAALGWNDSMIILDVTQMLNIDLYRNVNVNADNADEVFEAREHDARKHDKFDNQTFILRCIKQIGTVMLADAVTMKVYARFRNGSLDWCNRACLGNRADSSVLMDLIAGFESSLETQKLAKEESTDIAAEKKYTLGSWAG